MYVSFYHLLNPKSFVIGSLLKLCIYASYNKHFPRDGTTPIPFLATAPARRSQIYDYALVLIPFGLNLLCSYYRKHKFNNNYISFRIENGKGKKNGK